MKKKHERGIFERPPKSGTWWILWYDGSGRRHREKVGPKQLAVQAYHKRKTEVTQGKFFPELRNRGVLFDEICDDFEKHSPQHWSKGMFQIVRNWFPSSPVITITPQRVEQKLNKLISDGRTPATANRYRAILGAIFTWALQNGRITSNPARAVPLRRENNSRIRYLTHEEEFRLRKVLPAQYIPELDLALSTGMRKGNQYTLKWLDVDLEQGFITLRKTKPGEIQHIPINGDCDRALRLLRTLNEDKVCRFTNPRFWFRSALRSANIKDFKWHDLRHTFASRLTMAGRHPLEVKQLMGHKTLAMTERYSHLAPGRLREAVESISGTATATAIKLPLSKTKLTSVK